jgi:hypothetical protein
MDLSQLKINPIDHFHSLRSIAKYFNSCGLDPNSLFDQLKSYMRWQSSCDDQMIGEVVDEIFEEYELPE